MVDIMTLKPFFEFHVQIFSRSVWKTKYVFSSLEEADHNCKQLALSSLERCRILRVDHSPIKLYYYA